MNDTEKFQGKVKLPPKASSFDLLAFIGKATDHKMWINTGSGKYSRASWQLMATTSLLCVFLGAVSRCAELRLLLLLAGWEKMSNGYSDPLSKSFPINFHAFHNLCSK